MSQFNPDLEEKVKSDTHVEVKEPPLYKVLLLNDDYTTMEFVVEVLRYVFSKTIEQATQIMLNVQDGDWTVIERYDHFFALHLHSSQSQVVFRSPAEAI